MSEGVTHSKVNPTLPQILCVDDESKILEGIARTLRRHFQVTTALGSDSALQLLQSGQRFAVVVSDLQMPKMDGIEFLRWVAANAPDTSGILLTGNANLTAAIAAVNAGYVFRFLTKPCPGPQLIEAIHEGVARHDAKRSERLLLSQALDHDPLTGLPDRRRFPIDVKRMLDASPGATLTLLVIAVDEVNLVRGTLGHAAADELFIAAAHRLQVAVCDPRYGLQHAMLFRVDDRLALLWYTRTDISADVIAHHVLDTLKSDVCIDGQRLILRGRAGIADVTGPDAINALRNAEAACLDAIAAGDSRAAHFSALVNDREERRLQLLQRLRQPQFVEHLSCVYQPQWDLERNELAGIEALVRWHDPQMGAVSPGEFVPIAEQDAEIAERLGEWVLLTACRQRLEWRTIMPDSARIAVNISATQLRSGDLFEKIMRCLTLTGMPPELLEVEITESAAIADLARSDAQLQALRREGIAVAIDDFGVGFSSLSYLGELPASTLKIDRAFLRSIEEGGRRTDLLRGICQLGHAMRMNIVVEGVESLAIVDLLRDLGCNVAQGFAIARPLTPEGFSRWFATDRASIAATLEVSGSADPLAAQA
jgi:predicted signal transduction protein with EAL and GGDEF domain